MAMLSFHMLALPTVSDPMENCVVFNWEFDDVKTVTLIFQFVALSANERCFDIACDPVQVNDSAPYRNKLFSQVNGYKEYRNTMK